MIIHAFKRGDKWKIFHKEWGNHFDGTEDLVLSCAFDFPELLLTQLL